MKKLIPLTSLQLHCYLADKLEDRFHGDEFTALFGTVEGTIDDKWIKITYDSQEKYLLFSTEEGNEKILEELKDFFNEIMDDKEPICSYDLVNDEGRRPTLEWDNKDADSRIKALIQGNAYNYSKIENLVIKTSKDKSYYEGIKTRTYGLDSGSIKNPKEIDDYDEIDLFLAIDSLGAHIFNCNHNMRRGNIPIIDLTEEEYAFEYLINKTRKFGVELNEPEEGKHIRRTPSYSAWYSFYYNHFHKELDDDQWNLFIELKKQGKDVSMFLPKGNWRDLIEKPVTLKKENK